MLVLVLIAALLVFVGLWNYSNEVKNYTEHHEAEVMYKKKYSRDLHSMMYFYPRGYLADPVFPSYEYPENYHLPQVHEVGLKVPFTPTAIILQIDDEHLHDHVREGEKVKLTVHKSTKTNRLTKKQKHYYHPISVVKNNGKHFILKNS